MNRAPQRQASSKTSSLTPEERALIDLSAAIASRDPDALAASIEGARQMADPVAVDEVILQSHLFVGFPVALEAMILWRTASGTRPAEPRADSAQSWEERGTEVCARVYGSNYGKLRQNVNRLHPDLDHWMVEGGYGKVLGRPELELRIRELCIAALLAVWNTPRQLHSHLVGALNAGATVEQVDIAIQIANRYLDGDVLKSVIEIWDGVSQKYRTRATASH